MSNCRHLTVGSTPPPLNKGKLRLYSMRFCPYAQRVHLVLDAKKIPYDVVYVNLTEKPEWLREKSPLGKVPALELETGEVLYESLIVAEYVDTLSTSRPLSSQDPLRRAQDKILVERFNQFIGVFYKIYTDISALKPEDVLTALDFFEAELAKQGNSFFSGTQPGMVDYMIWPWCERADVLFILAGDGFILSEERFPKLLQWKKFMTRDDAVKGSYLSSDNHVKFINSRKDGAMPDYDMMI